MKKDLKIAIIGYGRLGKLFEKILNPYGEIFILDKVNTGVKQINYSDLREMDWIIISVLPMDNLKEVLKEVLPFLKKGALIMDTSSVKVFPCKWLRDIVPNHIQIMGTHPIFGPDTVKLRGIKDNQIVLCPIRISKSNLVLVKNVFKKIGLKVLQMSAKKHDKQAVPVLNLIHIVGQVFIRMNVDKNYEFSTLGYERLLGVFETVTEDKFQLFVDMNRYNPYAREFIKNFISTLQEFEKEIFDKK